MVDPNTRQGKRAPVTLKIKFKSATLEQFIERYAVDVSHGGIFIRTKEPLAVGTQMRFEFQLRDATPLITGEGTVVWTRENDPARPGVAPGMGVRFDRLNDGSQQVLDKILAEKSKGVGSHAPTDTKPPIFNEAPTKVAPSPLVNALNNESKPKLGQMAPPRAGFGDERTDATPLPKPMPFHSDADEFPDEAFEEATKVRSLDDLVAATKDDTPPPVASAKKTVGAGAPTPTPAPAAPPVAAAPVTPPAPAPVPVAPVVPPAAAAAAAAAVASVKDELAERRAARTTDAPAPEPPASTARGSSPPSSPSLAAAAASAEPAFVKARSDVPPTDRIDRPAGVKSARAEMPSKAPAKAVPVVAEPTPAPRGAPVGLLLLLLVVVGGGAAFWFFYWRNRGEPEAGAGSGQIASGSDVGSGGSAGSAGSAGSGSASGSGAASASGSAGASGSDGSAASSGSSGSAVASGSSGSAGTGSAAAAAPLVEVSITSPTRGATIDIADAGVSGAALPWKGKIAKGTVVKAHIAAPGFLAQDVEVTAGGKAVDVKLKSMPHVVHVTSKPGGAAIFVDGAPTRRTTPGDVELSAAQAEHGAKIELRKNGFDHFARTIKPNEFSEDASQLVASLDATLVAAKVVPTGGGGGSNTHTGSGSAGSAAGSAGSAAGSAGSAAGSAGSAAGSAGSAAGSAGSAAGSAGGTGGSAGSAAGSAGGTGGSAGSAGAGSASAGSASGSGAKPGSGAGSSGASGSGAGSSGASGSGATHGSGAGSSAGSGSAEPTPDWMK